MMDKKRATDRKLSVNKSTNRSTTDITVDTVDAADAADAAKDGVPTTVDAAKSAETQDTTEDSLDFLWPSDCPWPDPTTVPSVTWTPEDAITKIDIDGNLYDFKLDKSAQYMLDALDYYNELVDEGQLDEDYGFNDDYQDRSRRVKYGEWHHYGWEPDTGGEWWYGDYFDIERWKRDFSEHLNRLKLPKPNPVREIEQIIGYTFINENLLRQAFTRRAFAFEYNKSTLNSLASPRFEQLHQYQLRRIGQEAQRAEAERRGETVEEQISRERQEREIKEEELKLRRQLLGHSEQLEFMGDSVLNTVVTRRILTNLTKTDNTNRLSPFQTVDPSIPTSWGPYGEPIIGDKVVHEFEGEQTELAKEADEYFSSHRLNAMDARSGKLGLNEGDLTKIRNKFINKEYLASQAEVLGLDKFIIYGLGEEVSSSAREDMMEALIGAVAADCNWDWETLNKVVDRLVNIDISSLDMLLEKSYFDLFNSWHQSKFGVMPKYRIEQLDGEFKCELTFFTLASEDKDADNEVNEVANRVADSGSARCEHIAISSGKTKSKARESAAEFAYECVKREGLLEKNIRRDSHIEPNLDNAVNQIQELKQKRYIDDFSYYYDRDDKTKDWLCRCVCDQKFFMGSGACGYGRDKSKRMAKKIAALDALHVLFKSSSDDEDELEDESESPETVTGNFDEE